MFYCVPEWIRRFFLRPMLVSVVFVVCVSGCVKTSRNSPQAVTSTLASLVAKEARPQLKAIYGTAAKAVAYDGTIPTPLLRSTVDAAEYVGRLNGYRFAGPNTLATAEFSKSLDDRWIAAIGASDQPLTPEIRAKVVTLLQGVSDEF
jgi:hypothetical protein